MSTEFDQAHEKYMAAKAEYDEAHQKMIYARAKANAAERERRFWFNKLVESARIDTPTT